MQIITQNSNIKTPPVLSIHFIERKQIFKIFFWWGRGMHFLRLSRGSWEVKKLKLTESRRNRKCFLDVIEFKKGSI